MLQEHLGSSPFALADSFSGGGFSFLLVFWTTGLTKGKNQASKADG